MLLGELIESLDNPQVASRLVAALDDPALSERLAREAEIAGEPQAEFLAFTVRSFLETASDDHWLQLVGIMGRASDPGLAALRAILNKALAPPV